MISVQEIVNRSLFALDAEGSDRYLFDRDFKPAINSSVEWITDVINTVMSEKKFSEEIFRELTRVRVFQASRYSRVGFDETLIGDRLWTVLNIYAEPTIVPAPTPPAPADESVYEPNLSFISSDKSCYRATSEEWAKMKTNCFIEGSTFFPGCDNLKTYAYLNPTNYTGGYSLTNTKYEFEISPAIPGEWVAIRYIKVPSSITAITDNVELPASMTNLVVNKALNFISMKQNNQSTLYQVSSKEVKDLVLAKS